MYGTNIYGTTVYSGSTSFRFAIGQIRRLNPKILNLLIGIKPEIMDFNIDKKLYTINLKNK